MMKRMPSNFSGLSPWILNDFRSPRRNNPTYQDGWNQKGLFDHKGNKKKASKGQMGVKTKGKHDGGLIERKRLMAGMAKKVDPTSSVKEFDIPEITEHTYLLEGSSKN